MRRLMPWKWLACALAIAGCSHGEDLPPAPLLPGPNHAAYVTPEYRIQVGDVLSVRVLLSPELNEDVTVRPDGHISTSIAHDQAAANLTVPALIRALTRSYKHYLRNPHVSVIVKTVAPTVVFVGGEVAQPGQEQTVGTAPTLSQAIARAGGLKLSADEKRIFIVRRGPNNTPMFLAAHYNDVRQARDSRADVQLAPFDIVMVPRLHVAELYRWYNQYLQQFVNPSVGFQYYLNPTTAGQSVISPGR
jgi:protein involved in polysaccharide export with SLBB domain